ncbi:MAG: dipeptide ABC transporter ATP-binding protein [Granulosicoccus sp.]
MTEAKQTVLQVSDLHVHFDTDDAQVHAVKGVDVQLCQGECLGVVGESGSGKSQTFLAAMGLLATNGRATGKVLLNGQNILGLNTHDLNKIRGDRIGMIFQDPLTSLTPHLQIGEQMAEVLRVHQGKGRKQANKECIEWLRRVRITDAEYRLQQYPHELSGGMRQRVMIAMAMLCRPDVLIADEPTTALDVTIQAEILDLMNELREQHGTSIVLITHDMGVVARMCDRVQVMRYGEYVEEGSSETVFFEPQHDYTRMLLNAVPRIPDFSDSEKMMVARSDTRQGAGQGLSDVSQSGMSTLSGDAALLLNVKDIHVDFPIVKGLFSKPRRLRAVDGVSFQLHEGETLGVVGESGSGKSTLARAILQLVPQSAGSVSWFGSALESLDKTSMTALRSDLQIVFQDPLASLNPSLTIGDSIMEPLRVHQPGSSLAGMTSEAVLIMHKVGLDPALINRYPHELSGGQNQRVGIARAMILRPKLLICDEAVSALDVSIQAQIIQLIKSLQSEFNLSIIFISHDLSVVFDVAHRILVMYLGQPIELASARCLFSRAQHPYTRQLVSAVPVPDPLQERKRQRIKLVGELTSPMDPEARLRFLPSRLKAGEPDYKPQLQERFTGHYVAEHDPLETLLKEK